MCSMKFRVARSPPRNSVQTFKCSNTVGEDITTVTFALTAASNEQSWWDVKPFDSVT